MTSHHPSPQADTEAAVADEASAKSAWLALYVLCLGDLMIVLDQSIVNVALPSIRTDLGFSQASLAWVVNAYLLTFGGFLLLSGRLGDLLGNKRVFVGGVVSFTIASAVCELTAPCFASVSSETPSVLIFASLEYAITPSIK